VIKLAEEEKSRSKVLKSDPTAVLKHTMNKEDEGIRSKEEKREGEKSKELEECYERLSKYYAKVEEERKRRLDELYERLSKYYAKVEEERRRRFEEVDKRLSKYADSEEERIRRLEELYKKGYASG